MSGKNNVNVHMNWPWFMPQSPWKLAAFILVMILGSVVAWGIVLSGEQTAFGRIRTVELIVGIIVLAANIYGVLFRGYEGFLHNLTVTMTGHVVCSVIGFFIGGIYLPVVAQIGSAMLRVFFQFLLYIVIAFFLAVIPVLVICLIIWLVMILFGSDV